MTHDAQIGVLADGPSRGQSLNLEPGQQEVVLDDHFEVDGVVVHERHHYAFAGLAPEAEQPTATFTFSYKETMDDDTTAPPDRGAEPAAERPGSEELFDYEPEQS